VGRVEGRDEVASSKNITDLGLNYLAYSDGADGTLFTTFLYIDLPAWLLDRMAYEYESVRHFGRV
jgi:hypothetical protein